MLVEFQQALADVTADPGLCRAVRHDAALLDQRYALNPRERERLLGIVRHEGMAAACSVYRMNRLSPLAMNLRQTLHALGPQLAPTLDDYWRSHPRGHPHFHLESERFCRFLVRRIAEGLPVSAAFCSAFADDTARLVEALHAGDDEALPGTGLMNAGSQHRRQVSAPPAAAA